MAMASSSGLAIPIRAIQVPGIHGDNSSKQVVIRGAHDLFNRSSCGRHYHVKTKAAPSDGNPKVKSVLCTNCDGNGAVVCSQCKGSGVNAVDVFNGEFKAGDSCWLCGGKKDMLCGDCNGAGFMGGFLSTHDE